MTKIKLQLNWGLQPEITRKWGIFLNPPSSIKEINFPTEFYKEAFQELLDDKRKATLICIEIDDRKYVLAFDGIELELLEES